MDWMTLLNLKIAWTVVDELIEQRRRDAALGRVGSGRRNQVRRALGRGLLALGRRLAPEEALRLTATETPN